MTKDETVRLRTSEEEKQAWAQAAGFESFSAWARRHLNDAARSQGVQIGQTMAGFAVAAEPVGLGSPSGGERGRHPRESAATPTAAQVLAEVVSPDAPKRQRGRTQMCPHRLPPSSWCAVCDE